MDLLQILTTILTPALLLGVVAYLTKFFGRVITDQKPFTDDRKYEAELSGIAFMLTLTYGVVGVALALYKPDLYPWKHYVDFGVIFTVQGLFAIVNDVVFSKYYGIKRKYFNNIPGGDEIAEFFNKIGKTLPLIVPIIILFYVGTIEYKIHDWLWVIFIWSQIFFAFIQIAAYSSLQRVKKRVPVDVYFNNPQYDSLKGVFVLKVNDDNVRLRFEDRIMLINKSDIFKLEFSVPEDQLP